MMLHEEMNAQPVRGTGMKRGERQTTSPSNFEHYYPDEHKKIF
jgi:hypothetical protein